MNNENSNNLKVSDQENKTRKATGDSLPMVDGREADLVLDDGSFIIKYIEFNTDDTPYVAYGAYSEECELIGTYNARENEVEAEDQYLSVESVKGLFEMKEVTDTKKAARAAKNEAEALERVEERKLQKQNLLAGGLGFDTSEIFAQLDLNGIDYQKPPALLGAICKDIYATSRRPLLDSYPIYGLHALSLLAIKHDITGFDDGKLSLLTTLVSLSGAGKDTGQAYVKDCAELLELNDKVNDKPRSDKNVTIDILTRQRFLYLVDEGHSLLNAIGDGAQSSQQNIMAELLKGATDKLYMPSSMHAAQVAETTQASVNKLLKQIADIENKVAQDGVYTDEQIAAMQHNIDHKLKPRLVALESIMEGCENGVKNPIVSLALASTPERLSGQLATYKTMQDGFMARMLLKYTPEHREALRPREDVKKIDYKLIVTANAGCKAQKEQGKTSTFATDEALEFIDKLSDLMDQDEYLNHPTAGALFARVSQHVSRIGSIMALGDQNLKVTLEMVKWAAVFTLNSLADIALMAGQSEIAKDKREIVQLRDGAKEEMISARIVNTLNTTKDKTMKKGKLKQRVFKIGELDAKQDDNIWNETFNFMVYEGVIIFDDKTKDCTLSK
ncbi:hypothetical protein [Vibrio algicola]|uniref:DUF3987 domain-containing protein n=1 Tax=Vibrio algicola TaxID=2662262 RepID=A0A5Q0TFU2_9VIBR|nr:hypothetical protein [Vibrio algicola]